MWSKLLGRQAWVCKIHRCNEDAYCWTCRVCIDFNLQHAFCDCGEPAEGYVLSDTEKPLLYFCDKHYSEGAKMVMPMGAGI